MNGWSRGRANENTLARLYPVIRGLDAVSKVGIAYADAPKIFPAADMHVASGFNARSFVLRNSCCPKAGLVPLWKHELRGSSGFKLVYDACSVSLMLLNFLCV